MRGAGQAPGRMPSEVHGISNEVIAIRGVSCRAPEIPVGWDPEFACATYDATG